MDSISCLELALEGERLCKNGDFKEGVAFFEAAVKCGTNDMKTLSAIYSQLGNAFFYLGNYPKAMEHHKLDLAIAKSINDRMGEAKASGNLGNTLKMMNQYDVAVTYCLKHLEISRELNDKIGEGRALYNLGNVFHTKAKNIGQFISHDPGNFPNEVKNCLETAISYYKENLELMISLGDQTAQGRTYGNLGNTYYLLGDFSNAVEYHLKRLKIAEESNDKAAQRRAHCNLGNAHIFLEEFEKAVHNYKKTLILAEELKDCVIEAQSCYSLGNTYTLMKNYSLAIEYYLRHLKIAQKLRDRIGEGRAYWSLGNAMKAVGDHQKAMEYVQKHLEISKEIGDLTGQESAEISISELRKKLNNESVKNDRVKSIMQYKPMRNSMNKIELIKMTPDQKKGNAEFIKFKEKSRAASVEGTLKNNEEFFELVSQFQSKRMDDQRCSIVISNKENKQPTRNVTFNENNNFLSKVGCDEEFFDLIAGMQERRMNDQRAALPVSLSKNINISALLNDNAGKNEHLKKNRVQRQLSLNTINTTNALDDEFFDILLKSQANRLEDQRSEMPSTSVPGKFNKKQSIDRPTSVSSTQNNSPTFAPTVPDEDFFSLLMKFQSNRIEDQRTLLPNQNLI